MLINGYQNFTTSKVGVRSYLWSGACLGARVELENDISRLFPFINTVVKDAKYYDAPERVQFVWQDIHCTLYPTEIITASFSNEGEARTYLNRLVDYLNDLDGQRDRIVPNHKKLKSISAVDLYRLLPQTNCGECGFSTCLAFAASLSKGLTQASLCPGFKPPIYENAVYPVYDKEGQLVSTVELEKNHPASLQEPKPDSNSPKEDVRTDLTQREIQVLRLVVEGATNSEISRKLSISPHTVKSHMDHIFNKLTVNDRTQAAVYAIRHRIV